MLFCPLLDDWILSRLGTVSQETWSYSQWRSEAKCRPGPTIIVSPYPSLKFAYKNLKWKKIMLRAYLKIEGLINHFEDHNETLTNWYGSCFLLSILSLTFSLLVATFLIITFPTFFAFFAYAYMDPTCFVKYFPCWFLVSGKRTAWLFNSLLIPGDQTKNYGMCWRHTYFADVNI